MCIVFGNVVHYLMSTFISMQGFVIVTALLVTAFLQLVFEGKFPSKYTLSAMPLVFCSITIYQLYPYKVKAKIQ